MPLNIDWQQILLHWMNLAILTGGLYFLLYKPVKGFMAKREAHYKELDEQAAEKLAQAERVQAEYQAKLDSMEEELRAERLQSQQAVQKSSWPRPRPRRRRLSGTPRPRQSTAGTG